VITSYYRKETFLCDRISSWKLWEICLRHLSMIWRPIQLYITLVLFYFVCTFYSACQPRRSQGGGQRGHGPPKFLGNIVILCFGRRFSKQNSVIRLKSNILAPPNSPLQIFGLATPLFAKPLFTAELKFLEVLQRHKLSATVLLKNDIFNIKNRFEACNLQKPSVIFFLHGLQIRWPTHFSVFLVVGQFKSFLKSCAVVTLLKLSANTKSTCCCQKVVVRARCSWYSSNKERKSAKCFLWLLINLLYLLWYEKEKDLTLNKSELTL